MSVPKTLLVVENDAALRRLETMLLAELGHTVLEAADGVEALAVAARHAATVDLLVTDIVMPHLSGPDLASQLRALHPGIDVLYVSGDGNGCLRARGIDRGAAKLLDKPFTPDQLTETVSALL